MRSPEALFQLLLQAGGKRVAATGQSPDHYAFVDTEVRHNGSRHVAQPAGNLVSLNGIADRFGDDQPDAGSVTATHRASCMHDEIWLRRSHPVLDGGAELRRPCHPELSREHAA
jgi:hypothetical protein